MNIKSLIKHVNRDLGQHFLHDERVLQKMIRTIGPKGKDMVEIGPGIGNLTAILLDNHPLNLRVVEIDKIYAENLRNRYENLTVLEGDCLNFTYNCSAIVGNLPYNISTKLLLHLFFHCEWKEMHFLLQREVAERIVALPRTKTYGSLSVVSQLYANCKINFHVPPSCFFPAPKVISSFISFYRKDFLTSFFPEKYYNLLMFWFKNRRKKFFNDKRIEEYTPEEILNIFIFEKLK